MEDNAMKKIIIAAIAIVATLILPVSCTKQSLSEKQAETIDEGKVFTAVIEQDLTKTTLSDALKVHWENGDRICINGTAEYTATPQIPATKATFSPVKEEVVEEGKYWAIYPASLFMNKGYNFFPETQEYKEGSLNTPMYAESLSKELSFKNICGVLHFELTGSIKVKSIAVKALYENVCGQFSVSYDIKSGILDIDQPGPNDEWKTVTLDCGNGVQLDSEVATDFYISLPPQLYTRGMTITVTDINDMVFEKTTVLDITIERNCVYDLVWSLDIPVNMALANFFQGLSEDQAALAAATDEATKANPELNPEKFFLPRIHTWENALAAIKAIDRDMDGLPNEGLSDEQKQQKGELHFFRALCYFELFRTYGQAPIVKDGYKSFLPSKEIFVVIETDAKNAISLLPNTYQTDKTITLDKVVTVTRPTGWAAKALLARTYQYADSPLFDLNMGASVCKQYCDNIISNGGFSLEEYSDLWGAKAFDNKELIFGVSLASNDAYKGIYPTEHLYNNFESGDARLESTILMTDTGYNLKKPVDRIIPIFRFADILLIYAEVCINTSDFTAAKQYRDMLLARAGFDPSQQAPDMSVLLSERMKELAFEGHRFWDARRWGKAGEFFETIEDVQRQWNDSFNFYPVPQE